MSILNPRGGSSPRIRGKSKRIKMDDVDHRIIPANTGKITRQTARLSAWGDHPREYGENSSSSIAAYWPMGSSPRIRGKWLEVKLINLTDGIIPANTGKIYRKPKLTITSWDHPREYGENAQLVQHFVSTAGSSPRIRGKCLLNWENLTSKTDFTSLSFSASSSTHAGGFGPSSFHGSSSRSNWMPHQCESFHVGEFPLATVHSHNETLLVFVCWVCHNRAP